MPHDNDSSLFSELAQSLREAAAIAKGETEPSRVFTVEPPDVKAIRERVGLSQAAFARLIRVNVKTLRNWEQHRRQPTGPAAALLTIVAAEPRTAIRALHGAPPKTRRGSKTEAAT